MNFKNKKTNKKVKKRRTYKKYKGGDFTLGQKCYNVVGAIEAIEALKQYINRPFYWSIQLYDSTKCHLFIWKDETYDPHIHVHTWSDIKGKTIYKYTINKTTYSVQLMGKNKQHYESVLFQMYENLTGKRTKDPVFMTPARGSTSDVEPTENPTESKPTKPKLIQSGLMTDTLAPVQKKLGPTMGVGFIPKMEEGSLI